MSDENLSQPQQPEVAQAEVAPEPPARACSHCGAALNADQDWCLECGAAQPGRLGGRPGWRAALTVLGLTTVLAGGAAAAAYAALSNDPGQEQIAQAPQTAPPAVTPAPTVPEGTVLEVPTTETTPQTTPTIPTPDTEGTDLPDATDTPATPATPATPSTPSTGSGSTGSTGSSGTGSTGSGSTGSGSTGTTTTDTTETEPERVALDLPKSAASAFDPYQRATNNGGKPSDPADAIDGDKDTAWEAQVGEDGKVQVGLLIGLKATQALTDLELTADTPGFTVEMYGTRASDPPTDVTDERWEHVDDAADAGLTETLKLDGKYRHVLLWFTVQPADSKVRIPEVQLFDE